MPAHPWPRSLVHAKSFNNETSSDVCAPDVDVDSYSRIPCQWVRSLRERCSNSRVCFESRLAVTMLVSDRQVLEIGIIENTSTGVVHLGTRTRFEGASDINFSTASLVDGGRPGRIADVLRCQLTAHYGSRAGD